MKIEHIAIWVRNLELMRAFYTRHFSMESNEKYINEKKKFSSYFLSFESGARIEIMHRPDVSEPGAAEPVSAGLESANPASAKPESTKPGSADLDIFGLAHFAISVGSRERVDRLTEDLRKQGVRIVGEPRTTGDGCYESVLLDPEGNRVEITE